MPLPGISRRGACAALLAVIGFLAPLAAGPARAQDAPLPPSLRELQEIPDADMGVTDTMPIDIRGDALKEAALS